MKGYFVSGGYMGLVGGSYQLFAGERLSGVSGRLTHGAGSPPHTLPSQGHAPMGWQTGGALWKNEPC